MTERWKRVRGFEDFYAISNFGRLMSFKVKKEGKILKLTNKKGDYFSVVLTAPGKKAKSTRIHRLVAEHFIKNPHGLKYVNHIDGNKQNNHVSNLEWCTASHNVKESMRLHKDQCKAMNLYNTDIRPKKILQYSLNGEFIAKFKNSKEAQDATGVCSRNILQVAAKTPFNSSGGTRKQAGGYVWKFEEEVIKYGF